MSTVIKMGFEGLTYYGAAGSTASTQLTNIQDESISIEHEKDSTTTRGDGTAVPISYEKVVARTWSADWTMLAKTDDTSLEALKTAAANGTAVALRQKDYSSGKGFDGDVYVTVKNGRPLKGVQTFDFTATPTNDSTTPRVAQLYV